MKAHPALPQHLSQKKTVLLLAIRSRVEPDRAPRPLGKRDPLAELGFVECVEQMLRLEAEVGLERDHRSGIRHVSVHRAHASDVLNHELVRLFDVCKHARSQHGNRNGQAAVVPFVTRASMPRTCGRLERLLFGSPVRDRGEWDCAADELDGLVLGIADAR